MKNIKRVKFSISFKYITIFTIVMLVFLSLSVFIIFNFAGNDLIGKEEKNNGEINDLISQNVQSTFYDIQANVNEYMNAVFLFQDDVLYREKANLLFNDLCYNNSQIDFVYTSQTGVFAENKFLEAHPEVQEVFILWLEKQDAMKKKIIAGRPVVKNISALYNEGVICILYPFQNPQTKNNEIIAVGINEKKCRESLSVSSDNISYVVDEEGICLIHSDNSKVMNAENYSNTPFVNQLIKNRSKSDSGIYNNENSKESFYSANSILGYTMYVVTYFVPDDILTDLKKLIIRIALVAVFTLFLGIFIILIYSRKIAKTIERLIYITEKVGQRDYSTKLRPRSRDEVGYLTRSINKMQDSLRNLESENKQFEKFSNNMIAQKAIDEQLRLSGINRNATVLYANIKDFGAFAESQEGPATLKFLNTWYEKVESCVEKTGGYIDNFYGDSFLVVWGTVDSDSNPVNDAWNAVRCALLLRVAAYEVNLSRTARGKPLMGLCCGISSGVVTAGEVGFSQRSDYTIIGRTVCEAKDVRDRGKFFGTDILLSKSTYDLVCGKVIAEELEVLQDDRDRVNNTDNGDRAKNEYSPVFVLINAIGLKGPANVRDLKRFLACQER